MKRIEEVMLKTSRARLPTLKRISKEKILVEVKKVDNVLRKIRSENITSTSSLVYTGAVLVTETLGVKLKSKKSRIESMWKRRLENQIKQLRKDIARVDSLTEGKEEKVSRYFCRSSIGLSRKE